MDKKFILFLILILIPLLLLGYIAFKTKILSVKEVVVKSQMINCATESEIREQAAVLGQNLLLINKNSKEKKLKNKFSCIKSVQIIRSFPNKVSIEVLGREPAAILVVLKTSEATSSGSLDEAIATSEAYFDPNKEEVTASSLVDSEGVIISSDAKNLNYPKIYSQDKVEGIILKNALKVLIKLKNFGIALAEPKIYSQGILITSAKPKMIFSLEKNIDLQLASLQLILGKAKIDEENIEFIDLRFDKPIVRFAPKKK